MDCITVIVGQRSRAFNVNKSILRISCTYFDDQILAKKGKNAGSKEVRLPDSTIRAFVLYLGWLQTGCFYIVDEDDDSHAPDDEPVDHADREDMDPSEVEREKWYECYMLGHMMRDVGFQDACIDLAQEKIASGDDDMMIAATRFYTKISVPYRGHRDFAVAIAAHFWDRQRFEYVPNFDYPTQFVKDLVAYIGPPLRVRGIPAASVQNFFKNVGCKYHAHTTLKKPCYKGTHPAFK